MIMSATQRMRIDRMARAKQNAVRHAAALRLSQVSPRPILPDESGYLPRGVRQVERREPVPSAYRSVMPGAIASRNLDGLDGIGSKLKKLKKKAKKLTSPIQQLVKQAIPKPIQKFAQSRIGGVIGTAALPFLGTPLLVNKQYRAGALPVYAAMGAGGLVAVGGTALAPVLETVQQSVQPSLVGGSGGGGGDGDFSGPVEEEVLVEEPAAAPASSPLKPLLGVGAVLAALSFLR